MKAPQWRSIDCCDGLLVLYGRLLQHKHIIVYRWNVLNVKIARSKGSPAGHKPGAVDVAACIYYSTYYSRLNLDYLIDLRNGLLPRRLFRYSLLWLVADGIGAAITVAVPTEASRICFGRCHIFVGFVGFF